MSAGYQRTVRRVTSLERAFLDSNLQVKKVAQTVALPGGGDRPAPLPGDDTVEPSGTNMMPPGTGTPAGGSDGPRESATEPRTKPCLSRDRQPCWKKRLR